MYFRHVMWPGFAALALCAPVLADRTLSYVERSSGLTPPALEGGGTELEFADVNGDGHPDLVSVGDDGTSRARGDWGIPAAPCYRWHSTMAGASDDQYRDLSAWKDPTPPRPWEVP